jgi:hypothetical protein
VKEYITRWLFAMTEAATLSAWQSFYVIIGSSGAALIGIQFVVIALIANLRRRPTGAEISAFGTPTVMHLGGALLISAIMSAPWPSLFAASVALAVCGVVGLVYGLTVIHRTHRQTGYKPAWGDWLWYAILPCKIYAVLALAALFLRKATQPAIFVIGVAALGLLLVGIHNAWDAVTYMVVGGGGDFKKE